MQVAGSRAVVVVVVVVVVEVEVVFAVVAVVDGCLVLVVGGTAPEVGAAAAAAVVATVTATAGAGSTGAGVAVGAGGRKAAAVRRRTRAVFVAAAAGVDGAEDVGGVGADRSDAFAAGEAKNAVVVAEDSSAESCGGAVESLCVAATTSWSIQGCRQNYLHSSEAQRILAHP
ncbi:hypothetical protein PG987_003938 [Apiospora arundinis]